MSPMDEKTPEAPVEDTETPTEDVTLEAGADENEQASPERSPELTAAAAEEAEAAAPEAEAAEETPAAAAAPAEKEPEVRRYRPTESYAVSERIYHPVWDAMGEVKEILEKERVFRATLGEQEERGRSRMIRVEFDKEVPTQAGPRREVELISEWHGQTFDVGVQPAPPALPEVEVPAPTEEIVPPAPQPRRPALPEIPEEDLVVDEDEDTEEE